jgi:peptidoglycan/LPS O-acetylase OafA/YrhL
LGEVLLPNAIFNVKQPLATFKPYYSALTGLRAIAALLVYFFHLNPLRTASASNWLAYQGRIFIAQWNAGVTIFFVLSGFLITARYSKDVEVSWPWFRRFIQNRFARIYPIYFLLTLLTFALWVFFPQAYPRAWASFTALDKLVIVLLNITLTRAYSELLIYEGVLTAWSLTVEETFYLLSPLFLLTLKRRWWPLLAYSILFPLLGLLLVAIFTTHIPYYRLMGSRWFMVNYTFFGHTAEFMAGIGLALWVVRHPSLPRTRLSMTALGGIGLLSALLVSSHLSESTTERFAVGLVLALFCCPLFYGLISEQTWVRSLLETKIFQQLGKISYVFYLLHIGIFPTTLENIFGISGVWALLLSVTLASFVLYQFVELPLHKYLRAKPILIT